MAASAFLITFLAYLVIGAVPPIFAVYIVHVRFLGGIAVSTIVGIIAAVIGGLIDTLFLAALPDILVIAGTVDIVPPLIVSVTITTIFGLVSATNSG